ncbi:MAG: aspartyl/glutamyl-tRNA amidotransferase subunit C [Treponema sp.]|jgi:aspartyl-tRNA(Asn)/glutamyl-tRNA(Gln) amidotransferase subunit C|nr:aspartyl/glutamyl-tRNA amidotransferase subunit C [Treponema sp.]
MKIEDLQITAQLAHLNMDEEELAAAFPAFEQMLGFFAAMQAADNDTSAFPAGLSAEDTGSSDRLRSSDHFRSDSPNHNPNNSQNTVSQGLNSDRVRPDETLVSNLLNNAGDRDGRFIVIPNVL